MFGRRGERRGSAYVQIPSLPTAPADPFDLRSSPAAGNLIAWWDASQGVTMSPTALATGTTPPVVTFSGTLTGAAGKGIDIQCNDATTFRWNAQNLWGIGRGVGETAVTIPQGGTYALGTTGVVAGFAAGTYNSGHRYRAVAESVTAIVGGATMTLDNSTVYAAKGHIIGASQSYNDLRPSLLVSPTLGTGGMGTADSALVSALSGTNSPFHLFLVRQITSSNISTLPVAGWSFSHATDTTSNYLDARWYGPDATLGPAGAGAQHMIQRRGAAGAVQVGVLTSLNFGPELEEYSYDGTTVRGYLNGVPFMSAAWSSGAVTLQRFLLGAVKLGTNAVSNISHMRWQACAVFNTRLAESDSGAWDIRRRLA